MKKLFGPLFFAAALCAARTPGAEAPSLFSPEPPEPAAAALVETYMPLLAAGRFEEALTLTDLRSMRQYLLARRLADLQTKNPELTPVDIVEMSAQLQLNELNPVRLQDILLNVMQEASYGGMTWRIRGYAPSPKTPGDHLVGIDARTAEGKEKPILLGIRKLGEQWLIAPDIIEAITSSQPAVHMVPQANIPDAVKNTIQRFWKHWREGEMTEAHALFGAAYRSRVPLLAFLEQAQDFAAQTGVPTGWQIVQGVTPAPATLAVGVNVQGSVATRPTLMVFKITGETWVLEDLQLQMPRSAPAGGIPPPEARSFRSNLKPDLTPSLGPVLPPVDPKEAPPAPALPTHPEAPVGPEAP